MFFYMLYLFCCYSACLSSLQLFLCLFINCPIYKHTILIIIRWQNLLAYWCVCVCACDIDKGEESRKKNKSIGDLYLIFIIFSFYFFFPYFIWATWVRWWWWWWLFRLLNVLLQFILIFIFIYEAKSKNE